MSTSLLRKWLKSMSLKTVPTATEQKPDDPPESTSDISTSSSGSERSQVPRFLSQTGAVQLSDKQQQLLIHAPKEPFRLDEDAAIPVLRSGNEILIRVESIGLNPIDWKSPAFGWGLPSLPCVLGRDFLGTVVSLPPSEPNPGSGKNSPGRGLQKGDVVLAISTDYRDYRKAAFQQFSVAQDFNVSRIPASLKSSSTALPAIGVAFVTAAISLGVCLGLDLKSVADAPGPDLYSIVQTLDRESLAEDIRGEVFDSLPKEDRIMPGEWIAVWGASSTVGFLTVQLAKKAGLKVVAVADLTKNASKLVDVGADILVHRAEPEETVRIISSLTAGKGLRYGVDTVGKETSALLQRTFQPASTIDQSHLVCLVGSPKEPLQGSTETRYHKLPMKLFHESPAIGQALMEWLEDLLSTEGGLILPNIEIHHSKGLQSVNEALERVRDGKIGGHRLVLEI